MRKLFALSLAPALPVLLAATVLATRGNDNDAAASPRDQTTADRSTTTTTHPTPQTTTSTITEPLVVAPVEPDDAPTSAPTPTTAQTPQPSSSDCDAAALLDAIHHSDAVAPDLAFELTYLKCAEGYGWARISADFGDSATVLFEGSDADIELLDLGSSVCPTHAGMPEGIANRLAPPGVNWTGECGPVAEN